MYVGGMHCPSGDCTQSAESGISSATFYKYKTKYGGKGPVQGWKVPGAQLYTYRFGHRSDLKPPNASSCFRTFGLPTT